MWVLVQIRELITLLVTLHCGVDGGVRCLLLPLLVLQLLVLLLLPVLSTRTLVRVYKVAAAKSVARYTTTNKCWAKNLSCPKSVA